MNAKETILTSNVSALEVNSGDITHLVNVMEGYAKSQVIKELEMLNNTNNDYASIGASLFFRLLELKQS